MLSEQNARKQKSLAVAGDKLLSALEKDSDAETKRELAIRFYSNLIHDKYGPIDLSIASDLIEGSAHISGRGLLWWVGDRSGPVIKPQLAAYTEPIILIIHELVCNRGLPEALTLQTLERLRWMRLDQHFRHGTNEQRNAAYEMLKLLAAYLKAGDLSYILHDRANVVSELNKALREEVESGMFFLGFAPKTAKKKVHFPRCPPYVCPDLV
jgi:hypothetical protein